MVEMVTFVNLPTYHIEEACNFYCIIILGLETSEQPTVADTQLPEEHSKRHEDRKKRVNVNFVYSTV